LVRLYLEKEGFEVAEAARGDEALASFRKRQPDLVLLDVMLPGVDGLQVLKEIRKTCKTPVIMLTAKDETFDKVLGLELGADDYITKPFSPREVVARVKAVLRRAGQPSEPVKRIGQGDLEILLDAHTVRRAGNLIDLTPTEFNLLAALAAQPGRVFTRLQLLEVAQGQAYEGYERTVDAHIKNLRAKLELDPRQPKYLETVFGIGYRFHQD
jgi:DNA-binding response OmpR family regulator